MSSSSSTTSTLGLSFIRDSYPRTHHLQALSRNSFQVARILIFEPHADISALLELVVRRLGHEPVVVDDATAALANVDAAVIEPGDGSGLPLARRMREESIPVI